MKETLRVKDFGPIKDIELDLRKTTVFIGPQGSGKSTLAKLIAIFRDWNFLKEFKMNQEKGQILSQAFQNYNIQNYIQFVDDKNSLKTEFQYTSENYSIKILNGKMSVYTQGESMLAIDYLRNKEHRIKDEIDKAKSIPTELKIPQSNQDRKALSDFMKNYRKRLNDIFNESFPYIFTKSIYIPTERFLISAVSSSLLSLVNNNISLPRCLTEFGTYFENARRQLSSFKIPFLGITYRYENNMDRIFLDNNQVFNLSESASGFQAVIPMKVVIGYYSMLNDSINYSFIIEEPELNLYPTTQKHLIYYLSERCTQGYNELVVTTHSPYNLSAFNNLLLAYQTAQKHPEQKVAIEAVIPEKSWINPDDFAAYYINSAGTARSVFNQKTGLIAENELDDVSELIGEEFDELMEIYRSTKHESNH